MVILFYDAYRILSKVYQEGAYIKQAISEVPIEELNRAKTTKLCYGVLDKDVELSYYISVLCDKSPKPVIRILLKIAMYSVRYLGKKPYAVTDSVVELAKKLGKGGTSGFINAVLRRFYNETIPLPNDKIKAMSVKYSYPEFAVKRLLKEYGDKAESVMASDEEHTFVRFKTGFDGKKYLVENAYEYEKTPFSNLFDVKKIKINDDFYDGKFTFQSIGSVAICSAVEKGKNLLDACAAPGGKSVLLSEKFEKVTSFELHEHRTALIKSYCERMNVKNVNAVCRDSSVFDESYVEKFDAVLCDVPCSGYGTLKTNPDIKLKDGSYIDGLQKVQSAILSTCAKYVSKGGYLYYSTCSVFEQENDSVIEKFLENNKDFTCVSFDSQLDNVKKKYGLQFLPDISRGAGFYCAKLKRKD